MEAEVIRYVRGLLGRAAYVMTDEQLLDAIGMLQGVAEERGYCVDYRVSRSLTSIALAVALDCT